MKKTFTLLCLLFVFAVSAQEKVKSVPMSLNHHEFLLAVKKTSYLSTIPVPETYDEVSNNGVILYWSFSSKDYNYKLMPDGELRAVSSSYVNDTLTKTISVDSNTYYLRFVNGVVCGYMLQKLSDGTVNMSTYAGKRDVFETYKIKAVK